MKSSQKFILAYEIPVAGIIAEITSRLIGFHILIGTKFCNVQTQRRSTGATPIYKKIHLVHETTQPYLKPPMLKMSL